MGESGRVRPVDAAAWILCALAAAFGLWALHIGWHHSILDLHQWRQSHTALSAREMVAGGPFWRYATPILGPPWSSPIEMPLYQWIVATVSKTASLDLEATGRGVSVTFFLLTLASSWFALDILDVAPRYRPVFIALAMASPLYLFWSRTFMIESTALFFAVTYLVTIDRAAKGGGTSRTKIVWLVAAVVTGTLGGMVKVTTLVPWWTAAVVLTAARTWRRPQQMPSLDLGVRRRLANPELAGCVVALLVPVLAAAGWLAFSGAVKTENPLSARLAWSTVMWEHFGPLGMRFSPRSWYIAPGNTILGRTRHTVVGSAAVFAIAGIAAAASRRRRDAVLVSSALYFLPIAIFMHLYTVHVYYSYANGLLLLTIVGSGIVALLERRNLTSWLGVVLLTAALVAASTNYLRGYYVDQQSDDVSRWPLAILMQQQVAPEDVLLIYGLDLNPEFTYTAHRKAIMSWEDRGAGDPFFEKSLALLHQDGRRIGALVACGDTRTIGMIQRTARRLGLADRPSHRDVYCDAYYPRDRLPERTVSFP